MALYESLIRRKVTAKELNYFYLRSVTERQYRQWLYSGPCGFHSGKMDIRCHVKWLPYNTWTESIWSAHEVEWPGSSAIRSIPSEGNPLAKSVQKGRQAFDRVFDGFSWDSYYYAGNSM